MKYNKHIIKQKYSPSSLIVHSFHVSHRSFSLKLQKLTRCLPQNLSSNKRTNLGREIKLYLFVEILATSDAQSKVGRRRNIRSKISMDFFFGLACTLAYYLNKYSHMHYTRTLSFVYILSALTKRHIAHQLKRMLLYSVTKAPTS